MQFHSLRSLRSLNSLMVSLSGTKEPASSVNLQTTGQTTLRAAVVWPVVSAFVPSNH